jgi:hypothetical protein
MAVATLLGLYTKSQVFERKKFAGKEFLFGSPVTD